MNKHRFLTYLTSSLAVAGLVFMGGLSQVMATTVAGGSSSPVPPALSLKTTTKTIQTAYGFTLNLYENSGSYNIRRINAVINFPSADMQYLGSSGSSAFPGLNVTPAQNSVTVISTTSNFQRGSFLVATLKFKALTATKATVSTGTGTYIVDRLYQHFTPKNVSLVLSISESQATIVQDRINSGNSQIAARIKDLTAVETKMANVVTLSSATKASLTAQIAAEISGLNALKTKMDSDTTPASVSKDIKTIYTDYRVYVLILPKIALIETADKELVTSGQLSQLNSLLSPLVAAAIKNNTNGAKVAQLALMDMEKDYKQAQATAATVEVNVLPLQPSDYNSNPSVLKTYNSQLASANKNNSLAVKEANAVLVALNL